MVNNKVWIAVGIIALVIIFLPQIQKESKKLAGETMKRQFSNNYVNPGGTFTVQYNVQGVSASPYFFSIKDIITGAGCTLATNGGNEIITTITSPQAESGQISVKAPSILGLCNFNGDYQLGSNVPVSFSQESVEVCNAVNCVQSDWTPLTNNACNGFTYTQTRTTSTLAKCGGSCGTTTQQAVGNKDCGSTPSITSTDLFPNGCTGGVAGNCVLCLTYGDGFSSSCVKNKDSCNGGVSRTELGCVAQEWINQGGASTTRRYLGDSAQDWINKGGQS